MITTTLPKISINIAFGQLSSVINWCEQHCVGNWNFRVDSLGWEAAPGVYVFWFEDGRDYMQFTLRWM